MCRYQSFINYISVFKYQSKFLNQLHASQRPVHAWFCKIAFVHEVGMHVLCEHVCSQGYTSGMMWHDMNPYDYVHSWYHQ